MKKNNTKNISVLLSIIAATALTLLCSAPAAAYIGPGAGFALATSFFAIATTLVVVIGVLALLPVRLMLRAMGRGKKRSAKQQGVGRVVIVGLDGLDPRIAGELIASGKMPNFASVAEKGHFGPLNTTCPAVSPVAWSTFTTGTNPGRHNIFDFLTWDRANYLPKLSSSEIGGASRRMLRIGPLAVPLGRPYMRLLRKGKPFWDIIAENGHAAMSLRVPITFPPDKGKAMTLSGMCAPDLRGSQGTYSFYTDAPEAGGATTGGERRRLTAAGGRFKGELVGPPDPVSKNPRNLQVPFTMQIKGDEATIKIKGQPPLKIKKGAYSEWAQVSFKAAPGIRVAGIVRFLLRETAPQVKLYASPINIDPTRPALPVSQPMVFSIYLGKMLGKFSTLGLAEDTWALNQKDLSPGEFLDQVYINHADREKMLNLALDRIRAGLVVCVFDTPDRIQHMFYRQHAGPRQGEYSSTLIDMYLKMDELIGRTLKKLSPDDVLIVLSDHGVRSFARCFSINTWMLRNGYLALKPDADPEADYYQCVDWSRTRAFGLGLSGIYINAKGKGSQGIVEPADMAALKNEIAEKLRGIIDPANGKPAIRDAYDTARIYNGPYVENAPDLVVCYEDGWRTSWESVTGKFTPEVFSDNEKAWSGDHCADPRLVPGIILTNRPVTHEKPHIRDISATALSLFGIAQPENMQGVSLFE